LDCKAKGLQKIFLQSKMQNQEKNAKQKEQNKILLCSRLYLQFYIIFVLITVKNIKLITNLKPTNQPHFNQIQKIKIFIDQISKFQVFVQIHQIQP
jgi:hypothetical protein